MKSYARGRGEAEEKESMHVCMYAYARFDALVATWQVYVRVSSTVSRVRSFL